VDHIAIVERHDMTWHVHVPELSLSASVDQPSDAFDAAARLLAEAADLAPGEVQVDVRLVRASDLLVSTASSPVRARHFDGAWHTGQCTGWVRQANRSWRALVCYVIDGVRWERILSMGQFVPVGGVASRRSPSGGGDARAQFVGAVDRLALLPGR
jgi:hypothetical protein